MPRITFVFAFVVFAFVAVVKSCDFETIEKIASETFTSYKPMPTEWSATDQNKTKWPAFLANFFSHFNTKRVCSHELVSEIRDKLKVWKAITGCYVESATRQADGVLKMDYKKWNQEYFKDIHPEILTDPSMVMEIAKGDGAKAPDYIKLLQEKCLGDKNHIGNKLADHFEILMKYAGGILERMKGCFKGDKTSEGRLSAVLLNDGATPLFEELSDKAIVAAMRK